VRSVIEEVGQRFAVGFDGRAASAEIRTLIRDFGVGGVVLHGRNVDGPLQLAELVRELQDLARRAGHDTPLLVSVDQEGGRVSPFSAPWTVWPPARALGRLGVAALIKRAGLAMASELSACGIRGNFAPVVDVETSGGNPALRDRALSSEPDKVGTAAAALVAGLQAGRVAACAKHFPGQGEAEVDSSEARPVIGEPRGRLEDVELRPFRDVIAADVAMVMTSHALFPEIDERLPATLSPHFMGILRREMGFGGVIVTDDLDKKALAGEWEIGERAVLAAQAGCDVIRIGSADMAAQMEAMEGLIRATEGGMFRFTERDDVRRRLRRLKERFLLPYADPDPRLAPQIVGRAEHEALAREISDRSGLAA
jgi:beta-N-acetylhexosaminidase